MRKKQEGGTFHGVESYTGNIFQKLRVKRWEGSACSGGCQKGKHLHKWQSGRGVNEGACETLHLALNLQEVHRRTGGKNWSRT